jgi:hypothetical protein
VPETESPPAEATDPVAAVEEAAHDAAEAVEAVAETVADVADDATGEVPSGAADALAERVGAMEAALQDVRTQLAGLPGMRELVEAGEELAEAEGELAETAEAPVHGGAAVVRVERSDGESPPQRSFWPRWWPRWL